MKSLITSIKMLLFFTLLTGVIYPLLISGIGRVLFQPETEGSLILKDGAVIGSSLIGQKFEKPEFFHGRPSAVDYNAAGSGGSNFSQTNKIFIDRAINRAEQVLKVSQGKTLPADFIFASGSGLDPDISIEAAEIQVDRISSARNMDKSEIESIIKSNSERQLYFYGSYHVNVLKLNLALNKKGDGND